jgi:hypothetical protein
MYKFPKFWGRGPDLKVKEAARGWDGRHPPPHKKTPPYAYVWNIDAPLKIDLKEDLLPELKVTYEYKRKMLNHHVLTLKFLSS